MSFFEARRAWRRSACVIVAASAFFGAVEGASADDGIQNFFASIFGGSPQQAAPPVAAAPRAPSIAARIWSAYIPRRSFAPRPLVVRLHPAKPRTLLAEAPAKVGPVSIYEDRTLRRGDAVMTRLGVRVFAGSASWPYRPADFVGLDAGGVDRGTSKILAQLDKAPRD